MKVRDRDVEGLDVIVDEPDGLVCRLVGIVSFVGLAHLLAKCRRDFEEKLGDGLQVQAHGGSSFQCALSDAGEAINNRVGNRREHERPQQALLRRRHSARVELGGEELQLTAEPGRPGRGGQGWVRCQVQTLGDSLRDPRRWQQQGATCPIEGQVHVWNGIDATT